MANSNSGKENHELVPRHALEIADQLTKFGTSVSSDVKLLGETLREEAENIQAECVSLGNRIANELAVVGQKVVALAASVSEDCKSMSGEIDEMTSDLIEKIRGFAVKARSVGITHRDARRRLAGEEPLEAEHVLGERHPQAERVASSVAEALETQNIPEEPESRH